MRNGLQTCVATISAILLLSSCQQAPTGKPNAAPDSEIVEASAPPLQPERVSERPPNPDGHVLIAEYHQITEEETRWGRTVENFRSDLERLYALGYRPITVREYEQDEMDLAPGASPVIMTFDDSSPSQFRLTENGEVDPRCAVGIWLEFAEEHPDFPVKGIFYLLPNGPFGNASDAARKMELLKEWGCEVGLHMISHTRMDSMTPEAIRKELAESIEMIREWGFEPTSIAYPHGITPEDMTVFNGFSYDGRSYSLVSGMLVGANPAPSPSDPDRNLLRLPRVQAIEGPYGLSWWLDKVEAGDSVPYVAE